MSLYICRAIFFNLETYSHKIFNSTAQLPLAWEALAVQNIFLSRSYLKVLEVAAPHNMSCHFIAFFQEEQLIGIAVAQFLDLNQLESFGERDHNIKTSVRNFIFKHFASHVLFLGNNMLTGQNALYFLPEIPNKKALQLVKSAINNIKKHYRNQHKKIHLISIKDFDSTEIQNFQKAGFTKEYIFSTQPNMIFTIPAHWSTEEDYITALQKKYRDQYKRARKKAMGIEKQKMSLEDIIHHEKTIYNLYFHVAKNAPFNTFFLTENHFRTLKEQLKDNFLFYGYFLNNQLIGFNTLIKNGNVIDTYFLGYDDTIQKEKMLYLNMLYDMISYSIKKQFKSIVFARTALEIKSSVGAKPLVMYGLLEHSNVLIHSKIGKIFNYLEPKTVWQQRHPFKEL